jgi:hypothetical protein
MKPIAITVIAIGITILIWPAIVAYVLALLLISIGMNMILGGYIFSRKPGSSFKVGDYEVFKSKK